MSLILFDDIFFVLLPGSNNLSESEYAIADLDSHLHPQSGAQYSSEYLFWLNTPYSLIPELSYESGSDPLVLQVSHPFLTTDAAHYRMDTWPGMYTKCVYYVSTKLLEAGVPTSHWLTCLAAYNQAFFDQWHTACWSYKLGNRLFVFVCIDKALKEVKVFAVSSPDDSTYFLLKLLEKYKNSLHEMVVWTNEPGEHHLQILKKYVPQVIYNASPQAELMYDILAVSCVS